MGRLVIRPSIFRPDDSQRHGLRLVLALLVSVGLHALPALSGVLARLALRALPKPPIEVEILPLRKKAPAPPAVVPEPPAPPPTHDATAATAARKPKPADKKPERADKNALLPKGRLTGLGPHAVDDELGLRVLLRMPALRSTPHRQVVETLLAAFPDTHILAAGAPLPPPPALSLARAFLDDIDALLITTADPGDITATAFYAALRPGTALLSTLEKRRQLSWDRRRVRGLREGLFAFARPDLLGPGAATPSSPRPGAPPVAAVTPPAPRLPSEAELATWSERLQAALRAPGPAVYAEINNPQQRLRLRGEIPTPIGLRLALTADADPQLVAQLELSTADEAARLHGLLPGLKSELSGRLFWIGLGGLLSDLRFSLSLGPSRSAAPPSKSVVEVRGRLPRADVAVLLLWLKGWLPPPDRFPELVPPPAPASAAPADTSDAGAPDAQSADPRSTGP